MDTAHLVRFESWSYGSKYYKCILMARILTLHLTDKGREVLSQLKWKGGVPLTILETAQTIQSASEAVACTIAGATQSC